MCQREAELLHDYLAQVDALNEIVQGYFIAMSPGIHEGTPKEQYEEQFTEVMQAHKRLSRHLRSHGCGTNAWIRRFDVETASDHQQSNRQQS